MSKRMCIIRVTCWMCLFLLISTGCNKKFDNNENEKDIQSGFLEGLVKGELSIREVVKMTELSTVAMFISDTRTAHVQNWMYLLDQENKRSILLRCSFSFYESIFSGSLGPRGSGDPLIEFNRINIYLSSTGYDNFEEARTELQDLFMRYVYYSEVANDFGREYLVDLTDVSPSEGSLVNLVDTAISRREIYAQGMPQLSVESMVELVMNYLKLDKTVLFNGGLFIIYDCSRVFVESPYEVRKEALWVNVLII